MIIAVDAMGGDYGPSVIVPAALQALKKFNSLHLILVGHEDAIRKELKTRHALNETRLTIQATT